MVKPPHKKEKPLLWCQMGDKSKFDAAGKQTHKAAQTWRSCGFAAFCEVKRIVEKYQTVFVFSQRDIRCATDETEWKNTGKCSMIKAGKQRHDFYRF